MRIAEVVFLLLMALGLPLLLPPAGAVTSLIVSLLVPLLGAAATGVLRWQGALGCARARGLVLVREVLLAAAVGAAIGAAAANSLDAPEGVGALHVPLSLALSVLFGVGVAVGRTVPAGVGVVLALASPAFGPAVEELYTDVAMAAITAALIAFRWGSRAHPVRGPLARIVRVGVGLLMISVVLSTLAGAAPGPSSLVAFRTLSFLALPLLLLDDEELSWPWLVAGPAVASALLAVIALGMALERVVALGPSIGLYHRLWVVGMHPAHIGHWFAALFPLALAAALSRRPTARVAGIVAFSVVLVVVLLSYSRAAWAGAVLGGLVLGAAVLLQQRARARSSRTTGLAAAGAGLLLLLVLVLQSPARDHLTSMFEVRSLAVSGRLADLSVGGRMVADAPLLGHGPNARRLVGARFEQPDDELPSQYFRESGHNAPLKIAGESGLVAGVVFSALLLLGALLPLGRRARGFSAPGNAVAACGAGIAALVPAFLIGGLLDGPHALFWALLGAGVALGEQRSGGAAAPEVSGGLRQGLGLVAGLALAVWALIPAWIGGTLQEALQAERDQALDRAEGLARSAASRAPWLSEPHEVLARILVRRQAFDEAAMALERAVRASGESPDLLVRLAGLELRRGRLDPALAHLDAVPDAAMSADALGLRVAALLTRGEADAAAAALADRLVFEPVTGAAGFPPGLVARALDRLQRRLGATEGAPALLRREALALGRALESLDRDAAAIPVYEALVERRLRDPEPWRRLAAATGRLHGAEAEVAVLRRALDQRISVARVSLQLALGRAMLALDRPAEARPALEVAFEGWRDPYIDPLPVLGPLAVARERAGDASGAEAAREAVAYLTPLWAVQLGRAVKDSALRPVVEAALGTRPEADR